MNKMGVPESLRVRLETQLDALDAMLADVSPAVLEARPASGDWSARENLAHLARHQAVFIERLDRILHEDTPQLGRYAAEKDPEWADWSRLPLDEVLRRLKDARRRLVEWTKSLSRDQVSRTGLHPTFGEMTIPQWLEFFLLHEAHHLYVAMIRIGEGRRTRS